MRAPSYNPIFADITSASLDIVRSPPPQRTLCTTGLQTVEVLLDDDDTQTHELAVAGTQTQGGIMGLNFAAVAAAGGEGKASDDAQLSVGLAAFLARAGPLLEAEMSRVKESRALEGYVPLEDDGSEKVSLLYTLSVDFTALLKRGGAVGAAVNGARSGAEGASALQCTGVGWSAAGSTLIASFGRRDIAGWCDLPGALAVWRVFRRGFAEAAATGSGAAGGAGTAAAPPDAVLDHSSCLMCVACHPVNPSLVAAGSFNGEVLAALTVAGATIRWWRRRGSMIISTGSR
ncbi:unnamed protein product [Phaeothamnion confervicola]